MLYVPGAMDQARGKAGHGVTPGSRQQVSLMPADTSLLPFRLAANGMDRDAAPDQFGQDGAANKAAGAGQ